MYGSINFVADRSDIFPNVNKEIPVSCEFSYAIAAIPSLDGYLTFVSVFRSMFRTIIEKGNSAVEEHFKLKNSTDRILCSEKLIQMYENWINYVKKTVPKDQLLIFNAKDGVEKLAKFLEIKTPSWKLPHMNGEIFIEPGGYEKSVVETEVRLNV